jgi:hypothetical protein
MGKILSCYNCKPQQISRITQSYEIMNKILTSKLYNPNLLSLFRSICEICEIRGVNLLDLRKITTVIARRLVDAVGSAMRSTR